MKEALTRVCNTCLPAYFQGKLCDDLKYTNPNSLFYLQNGAL